LTAKMAPVDILRIEGCKAHKFPKIEVNRPSRGKKLLCQTDDSVVALATDEKVEGVSVPQLDLNDVKAVADYIVSYLKIES